MQHNGNIYLKMYLLTRLFFGCVKSISVSTSMYLNFCRVFVVDIATPKLSELILHVMF